MSPVPMRCTMLQPQKRVDHFIHRLNHLGIGGIVLFDHQEGLQFLVGIDAGDFSISSSAAEAGGGEAPSVSRSAVRDAIDDSSAAVSPARERLAGEKLAEESGRASARRSDRANQKGGVARGAR